MKDRGEDEEYASWEGGRSPLFIGRRTNDPAVLQG